MRMIEIFYCLLPLSFLSLLSGVLLILAYLRYPSLRKAPGMFILYQCIAQLGSDVHWIGSAIYILIEGYPPHSEPEPNHICRTQGLISTYVFFLALNYILCISLEIVFRLRNPMDPGHCRGLFLHVFSHLAAGVITILMGVFDGAGDSLLGMCFVRAGSWADNLMYAPLCFYYPATISAIGYAFVVYYRTRMVKRRIFLVRFSIVIFLYEICWAPMCVLHVSHAAGAPPLPGLSLLAWVFSSLAGLFINSIRLLDFILVKRLKCALRKRAARPIAKPQTVRASQPSINTVSDASMLESDVHQFLCDVFLESVLSAFLNVSLAFRYIINTDNQSVRRTSTYNTEKQVFYISPKEIDGCELLDEQSRPGCKGHLVEKYEVRVTAYASSVFAELREMEGLEDATLLKAFSPVLNRPHLRHNVGNRGGRSDAFISFTSDRLFLLKTLNRREKRFLLSTLLPGYFEHIKKHNSLLARLLAVFRFDDNRGNTFNIVLMRSIIEIPGNISALFDLKGSQVARKLLKNEDIMTISGLDKGTIYKDMDFLQTVGSLELPISQRERLLTALHSDILLLTRMNIMDYSLLIAFVPHSDEIAGKGYRFNGGEGGWDYYMGVIDYLQEYTRLKRLETLTKKLVNSSGPEGEISIVDPEEYASRFVSFVAQITAPSDRKGHL